MRDSNRVWLLLAKKLTASATDSELNELHDLLSADPELWYSFELLEGAISANDIPEEFLLQIRSLIDKPSGQSKIIPLLKSRLHRSSGKPQFRRKNIAYALAAMVSIIALISWLLPSFVQPVAKPMLTGMNEIVAPRGSKAKIVLADGTSIWLNAGSKLRYSKNFSLEKREVFLFGEAYFRVLHNAKHPFVVHTSDVDIKDLGTVFNVKAYGEKTETTLIEGSVEITLRKEGKTILLKPSEKVVLHGRQHERPESPGVAQAPAVIEISRIVPYQGTNQVVETSWVSDKLIFRNERFDDLAKEMERRFNVTIIVKSNEVKEYRLTGVFKNETVKEALQLLQVIAPFKYQIKNEKISIEK